MMRGKQPVAPSPAHGDVNNQGANYGQQTAINYGSVYQYTQTIINEASRYKLLETVASPEGYVARNAEAQHLVTLLTQTTRAQPIFLSGLSGTGKTWLALHVVHQLQEPPRYFGGILWGSLADLEPHHLLHQWFPLLGHQVAGDHTQLPRTLFWDRVARYSEDQGRLLVVFDDVHHEQHLRLLLPDEHHALQNCCVLVICSHKPQQLPALHEDRHCELKGLTNEEAQRLFWQYLDLNDTQKKTYQKHFAEITQRLGALPLLLATAARDMATSKIYPGSYAASLREQHNPGSQMGHAVMDGLQLALRDLSPDQHELFTLSSVLGSGSWRREMLAAVVIRRSADIQTDLTALVRRGLVHQLAGERYQMNGIVREFAQAQLQQRPAYVQHAAYSCLIHECLTHARRLESWLTEHPDMRALAERTAPHYDANFISAYHQLIAPEISHIQQAMMWARQHEHWHLLLRFADVASNELLHSFVAGTFDELRLTFVLATIVEPVVWKKLTALQPDWQALICASGWPNPPKNKNLDPTSDGRSKPELGLTIQGGRIIDGFFDTVCFLDTRWVGVHATRLICCNSELIGCECVAVDLSQSVWVDVDAHQLTLTGAILNHALLHNVRLHRADLHDADLTGAVLEGVRLRGANLRNCNLSRALLDGVDLRGADLRGAQVTGAIFHNVQYQGCRADGVDWETATIIPKTAAECADIAGTLGFEMKLPEQEDQPLPHPRHEAYTNLYIAGKPRTPTTITQFQGADFRMLHDTDDQNYLIITDCDFRNADFRAANLARVDFSRANLQGADFRGAFLDKPIFRRADLRGADLRAVFLEDADLEEADLTDAQMRFAIIQQGHLKQARMRAARLRNATLEGAFLENAELSEVDLSYANLKGAHLDGASLIKANLRGAHFRAAQLSRTDLSGADCDETDFTGATLDDATLARASSWRRATLPHGKPVLVLCGKAGTDEIPPVLLLNNSPQDTFELPANLQEQLRLAYLEGTFDGLNLPGLDLLGAQLLGDFVSCSFVEAVLDHARLSGNFSVVDWTSASLKGTTLSGILTAAQFTNARLNNASMSGVFVKCSFKEANLQDVSFEGASLVGCDFTGAHLDESALRRALRLRGSKFPDGERYLGDYNLAGDRQDAHLYGYNLEDPNHFDEFYQFEHLKRRKN